MEFHKFCPSPRTIKMIKSRAMTWAGHVAPMGKEEKCIQNVGGKARRKKTH
jgi:hypothetical protein